MLSPFESWDGYLNYHNGMNRWQVCLKNIETGERRTLLYSKFLMSIKVSRWLEPEEEVDHIDGNKNNDSIDNLQIMSAKEHNVKTISEMPKKEMFSLDCSECGCQFEREKRQMHKNSKRVYCSNECRLEALMLD